jgi:hypothetical protein
VQIAKSWDENADVVEKPQDQPFAQTARITLMGSEYVHIQCGSKLHKFNWPDVVANDEINLSEDAYDLGVGSGRFVERQYWVAIVGKARHTAKVMMLLCVIAGVLVGCEVNEHFGFHGLTSMMSTVIAAFKSEANKDTFQDL